MMTNGYAPREFLRHVPMTLLREYFGGDRTLDVEWGRLGVMEVEPIYRAWQTLPEPTRGRVESDFRRIHSMGVSEGVRTLVEEGQTHGLDLTGELDGIAGHVRKAFHVFMRHGEVFWAAERLHRVDHLSGRYWRKRKGLPRVSPDVSPRALGELAASISAHYRERQGRGEPCQAEAYLRAGGCRYVFVYPRDYADMFTGFDSEGRLERRAWNPAFEIVYCFDPADGSLDLYVQGDKRIVHVLQKLFGRAILHHELGEESRKAAPYDLSGLKRRDFRFPTDPADRVRAVAVTTMKLTVLGDPRRRITFESAPSNGSTSGVHDLMDVALSKRRLPLSMVNVGSAVIRMVFDGADGHGRSRKVLSFRVSYPNWCSLKDSPEELVAKKYLKEWGIERP
jgi:hypothetical protein